MKLHTSIARCLLVGAVAVLSASMSKAALLDVITDKDQWDAQVPTATLIDFDHASGTYVPLTNGQYAYVPSVSIAGVTITGLFDNGPSRPHPEQLQLMVFRNSRERPRLGNGPHYVLPHCFTRRSDRLGSRPDRRRRLRNLHHQHRRRDLHDANFGHNIANILRIRTAVGVQFCRYLVRK